MMKNIKPRPENRSISDLLENELYRYKSKGWGCIIALIVSYSYLFLLPEMLKPLYMLLPHDNLYIMYALGLTLIDLVTLFLANFALYLIYRSESPYFEQYKVSSEPWEWKTKPSEYKKKVKNSVFAVIRNILLVTGLGALISVATNGIPYNTNPHEIPSGLQTMFSIIFFMIVDDTCFYWLHRL